MKFHRPIFQHIVHALAQTFSGGEENRGYHADKVLERLFQSSRKLGSRDRRFIAESVYDIVRWWRLLMYCSGQDESQAINEPGLWRTVGAWLVLTERGLPDWPEFSSLDTATVLKKHRATETLPAIRESYPDWFYKRGEEELGEKWKAIAHALNQPAPVFLRVNRLKITREDLKSELHKEGIEASIAPGTDDGLVLKERKNIFTSEAFKKGLFELQDGASQQAAIHLSPQSGDRIIDACAGAGGKSLHLAALMKNKGKIIAMDIHPKKLDELRKRASRAGADIIETRAIESTKTIKRLEKMADRLLLDVPCSGSGVLRRNPDKKWKFTREELDRLIALQSEILSSYSHMLKPGGRMVYATCSILPSENREQVQRFLDTRKNEWEFIDDRQIWPGENGHDGFYIATLKRI